MSEEMIVLEFEGSWTANTFFQVANRIAEENPQRPKAYSYYGAFHAWKRETSNFSEVTKELFSEGQDVAEDYMLVVDAVCGVWRLFCSEEQIPEHAALADRWYNTERAKCSSYSERKAAKLK